MRVYVCVDVCELWCLCVEVVVCMIVGVGVCLCVYV